MKVTATFNGGLETMIQERMEERGISEQEALRSLLGDLLACRRVDSSRLQSTPVDSSRLSSPGTAPATHVEESSSKSSPSEKKEEKQNTYCAAPSSAPGELVLFPDLAAVESAKEAARKKRDADREAELAWRITEVWEDFLFAREAFFRDVSGVKPGSVPEIRLVRNDIRQALLIHDRDRLAIEDRDRWRRESPVRAAGIGIFYDPWCAGTSPQNDARNGGKRYLEPWRPWKPQRGKPDPVPRFAELYFEVRDQEEARRS